MKFLTDLRHKDLSSEICILRVDLNVETADDSWKFRAAIPTIHWLLQRHARIVIVSHRGRPKGSEPELSLKNVAELLQKELFTPITFLPLLCIEEGSALKSANGTCSNLTREIIEQSTPASVFLLENIRFMPGEETNDDTLAQTLASLGTIYVNDAFAVSHRANASVAAITKYLPSYAGPLFEKEYKELQEIKTHPKRPLVFVLGGAKTAEKMGLIKYFVHKAEHFLVGGVVANTFLKANGVDVGSSKIDDGLVDFAKEMLATKKILLPEDWKTQDGKILDIGPKTIKTFSKIIQTAATIIWSGPMGVTETKKFAAGTIKIAEAIIKSKAFTVAGGGDTTQFLFANHLEHQLSFLSTGGGAMLEFLAGKSLPGIEALR